MKFGKSLFQVIELSDPEWGPFWINYKYLKRKINDIVHEQEHNKDDKESVNSGKNLHQQLSCSTAEVEFFRLLKKELKKTSEFFKSSEDMCKIRRDRLWGGLEMLKKQRMHDDFEDMHAWTRLMASCVKFYKDVLLLENYAIMNYCGFSKILKKHDKRTGYKTRDAFMLKVMSKQNFTQYPYIVSQLKEVEAMFDEIQSLHSSIGPMLAEERLFIEAIRDLNYQASQLQSEENSTVRSSPGSDASDPLPSAPPAPSTTSAPGSESDDSARTVALLEASIRANVSDPAPNMQSILTWMKSVSGSGALVPAPSAGPGNASIYTPRGLQSTSLRGSPVCEGGIAVYQPPPSSHPPSSPTSSPTAFKPVTMKSGISRCFAECGEATEDTYPPSKKRTTVSGQW